jgi:uncharacterized protein YndB with AHSA1/START domain
MSTAEMSRIDRSIDIAAPPDRVFRALTSPEEVAAWFRVKVEGQFAPGADVWMTSTQAEYAGIRFSVRIKEITPPRRVVWEWHPGAVDPAIDYSREPVTTVTFDIQPAAGGGTRVTVSETGFDRIDLSRRAKVYADNTQGWATVIVWIKDHVEAAAAAR